MLLLLITERTGFKVLGRQISCLDPTNYATACGQNDWPWKGFSFNVTSIKTKLKYKKCTSQQFILLTGGFSFIFVAALKQLCPKPRAVNKVQSVRVDAICLASVLVNCRTVAAFCFYLKPSRKIGQTVSKGAQKCYHGSTAERSSIRPKNCWQFDLAIYSRQPNILFPLGSCLTSALLMSHKETQCSCSKNELLVSH